MSVYYPTIARVVADLPANTGETRRALYERARAALIYQLKGRDPPLTEADVVRERLALEEAIRRVETEEIRRQQEPSYLSPVSTERARQAPPTVHQRAPSPESAASPTWRQEAPASTPRQRSELQSEQTDNRTEISEQHAKPHARSRAIYARLRHLLRLDDSRPVVLLINAVYERVRASLFRRLKGRDPPPSDVEIQLKRLARDKGVRRGETGNLRRQQEVPSPNSISMGPALHAPLANQERIAPTGMPPSPPPRREPLCLTPPQRPDPLAADANTPVHPRLLAMIQAGRYQGIELDPDEFRQAADEKIPSAAALSQWAQDAGMWSRAIRVRWRQLLRLNDNGPVVLLFTDGTAALMTGADAEQMVVYLKDPNAPTGAASISVDELRLSEVWAGEVVLLRATRGHSTTDTLFNFRWLADLVLQEHRSLRDIGLASLTISFLTIFPPLLVMMMVNKVLQFHSVSTLVLLSVMMAVVVVYEMLLGYARRLVISVISARLDAKLNLHIFNRLLRLPLDYFERHPPGETMYRIAQIYRVREFLTGKLLSTFLDLITLCVLLPFLFYLNALLAAIVLVCAAAITLIIMAYLKPLRIMYSRVAAAETWKSAALGETISGIKTVKALALEPQRRALWDERIAEAGKWRLAFGRLANWPQTLVLPIERIMVLGTMMIGAYMAMNDPSGYLVGGLFAFLMLSQRVSQPLVGLSRLVEDFEEVGAAIGEAGSVLNRPLETSAGAVGLRPKFEGAINFQDVTFTYVGTKVPALDRVSFSVPAGTILGIVGRSGSGKSTITRLLQGINRDYGGYLKIDGSDLREVDLRHLRQSLGVVLQNNFLFRGSIRDNIIAGRPGLTLADVVNAARLAGAEEFIERMPNGYETYIEEGSPNLSGGQTQRLAIARALIHDPRILVLDEATSALDPESEAVVNANLLRIARGRTMVLVSHRLSSLMECNQILVMEAGKVVDIAPHSVLLERCPVYRQLWSQQNRHLESQGPRHAVVAPRLVPGG